MRCLPDRHPRGGPWFFLALGKTIPLSVEEAEEFAATQRCCGQPQTLTCWSVWCGDETLAYYTEDGDRSTGIDGWSCQLTGRHGALTGEYPGKIGKTD